MKERIQNIIFAIIFSALLYGGLIRIIMQQDYAHATDFAYQNSLILILHSYGEECVTSGDGWYTCYDTETNKISWYQENKKPLVMDYGEVYQRRIETINQSLFFSIK